MILFLLGWISSCAYVFVSIVSSSRGASWMCANVQMALVQIGELSAGRAALEGASLAPGNETTRRALVDEFRRPSEPVNSSATTSSSVEARGSLLTTTSSQRTFGSREELQLGIPG